LYFLTYKYEDKEEIGILTKDKENIIPINYIFSKLSKTTPKTMNDLITISNDSLISEIKEIINNINSYFIPINKVKICAPIPYPKRNLICLGKNYADHVKEIMGLTSSDTEIPKTPIYFSKIAYPAIGDKEVIRNHHSITQHIDYEVELAVVIGKDGKNISKDKAFEYIFGYTIANDVTARNLQRQHKQWFKGKSLDSFAPMGPYIVHKSEIPFPVELEISCKVNGEVRQHSNTKNMIFDIPYIINDLSKSITLRAGDIILTGTPSGVGLGFNPPRFLKSGDTVECYIEKIGTLTNIVE
jgi:2-keto-4-pentenoate hydratase/2-oxohepta-3-ene-1,7-dioic acid hydratase in catechol pathway